MLALHDAPGHPNPLQGPDAISRDKLVTMCNWMRIFLGFLFNSRKMTSGLSQEGTKKLIGLLTGWLARHSFTLLEAVQLLGMLQRAICINRWVRPCFLGHCPPPSTNELRPSSWPNLPDQFGTQKPQCRRPTKSIGV